MPSSNENGWPSPSGGDAQQATAPSGDRAPKRDWGKVGALAGLAAVAVAVAVFLLTRGDSRPNSTSVNSGNSGVSCSASGGAKCEQTVQSLQQQSEDEILKQSSKVANGTPAGAGPWPFIVAKDLGIGLKVRTNGLKEGHAIGGLATHHAAWVVCQTDTGFDPDGNGSSTWYQVTWPSDAAPSSGFLESEVSSPGRAWAYATYLFPVASNRDVPKCP